MAKRSPWATQSRRTVKAIRGEFKQFPQNEKLASVLNIVQRKTENIPHQEKVNFLLSHPSEFLRALKKEGEKFACNSLPGAENRVLLEAAKETVLKGKATDFFVLEIAKQIILGYVPQNKKMFSRGLKNYLEERKIPFDRKVFEKSFEEFMNECPLEETVKGKINLAVFERKYLKGMRDAREIRLVGASVTNGLIKKVFHGVRLTPNQRRAARRWILQHHNEFFSVFKEKIFGKNLSLDEAHSEVGKVIDVLAEKMRAELLPIFVQNKNKYSSSHTNNNFQQKKLGDRLERINSHVKEERNNNIRLRVVQEKERAATISGTQFDSVSFCLGELRKENPLVAEHFLHLVKTGTISASSLKSLYTSGSLAQKTFLNAVDAKGFVSVFGEKQVSSLAKFIAFVGPGGRKIDSAKRAMQSPKSEEIYRFLQKNKLIETHHGGGTVVYLAR